MSRRRAPEPLQTPGERRGYLRSGYVQRFLDADSGRRPFADLWEKHRARAKWPPDLEDLRWGSNDAGDRELVDECDAIAARLRLPELARQVYRWLADTHDRALTDALREVQVTLGRFAYSASSIGDVEVSRTERAAGGLRIVEIVRRPLILWPEAEWDPSGESRQAARKRLFTLATAWIDASLDRIERHAEDVGFEVRDSHSNVERNLGWLVARVRDGQTYAQIADAGADEDAVRHAIAGLATVIGLQPEL